MKKAFGFSAIALAALCAVPAAAPAQAGPAPAASALAPVPTLAQIPGVVVRHYDVTGATIKELQASIAAQRPMNPATKLPIPSSASWSIATSIQKSTTGNDCRIASASPTFKAEVVMPRLADVSAVSGRVRTQWQTFVATLEQQQAAHLLRPYQRLSEVERAVLASSCEGADEAAAAAIAEITKAPPPAVQATPAK